MFTVILGQFIRFVSKNTSVFCLFTLYRENALQNGSLGRHGRIGKEGGGTCARWSSTLIAQVHPSFRPSVRPSLACRRIFLSGTSSASFGRPRTRFNVQFVVRLLPRPSLPSRRSVKGKKLLIEHEPQGLERG